MGALQCVFESVAQDPDASQVFGPETGNMPNTGSSRSGGRDLYELFVQLSQCASVDDRRCVISEIAEHSDLFTIIRRYCADVWKGRRRSQIAWEDLLQATYCRFLDSLVNDGLAYCDKGLLQFWAWFRTVILTTAEHAACGCEPPWDSSCFLVDPGALAAIAPAAVVVIDRDEFLALIESIPDPKTRAVIRDQLHDLSVAESAESRGMTEREVRRRRKHGHKFLRRHWPGG
jgi:DNA-directed RNA polymerase specialized sigma24 family protein